MILNQGDTNNKLSPTQAIDKISQLFEGMSSDIEDLIYLNLISQFVIQDIDPVICEEIVKGIYMNTYSPDSKGWNDYQDYIDKLYQTHDYDHKGLNEIEILLSDAISKRQAKEIIVSLKQTFRSFEDKSDVVLKMEISTDNFIWLNEKDKTVELLHEKLGKSELNTYQILINAYPKNIIIHNSPLEGSGTRFSIDWETRYSKRLYSCKNKTISEIATDLKEGGYVLNKRKLDDTLSAVINIANHFQKAVIKEEIEEEGFFYDIDSDSLKINYSYYKEPTVEDVKKALKTINRLLPYFKGNESKLATGLKWGLLSPFSYAIKQIGGHFLPYTYFYGKAGSGKTSLGKIMLYLYGEPNNDNDLGGSNVSSVAQLSAKLSKSTLPILINEPEGVFSNPALIGMIKTSVMSTISRGKFVGNSYQNFMALASVIITANMDLPTDDALNRRFEKVVFTQNEKKSKNEQREFDDEFMIESPRTCLLHDLKGLSNFVIYKISENPHLLKDNWKDLADYLIKEVYDYIGEEPPKWFLSWVEESHEEDVDSQEIEEIRAFLLDTINDKFNKKINLKIVEEIDFQLVNKRTLDDYDDVLDTSDFQERVYSVINQHLIPFMTFGKKRDGNTYVYFDSFFKKELINKTGVVTNYSLKSIAELLDSNYESNVWRYGHVSVGGTKGTRMYIKFEDFMEFLYPHYESED